MRMLGLPLAWLFLAGAVVTPSWWPGQAKVPAAVEMTVLLRPVALALSDERWLAVANRRSGTVAVIDLTTRRVVGETKVARTLSDLVALPSRHRLLALDEDVGELIVLECRGGLPTPIGRTAVAPFPVSLQVTRDGNRCFVASQWSRRVTALDLGHDTSGSGAAVLWKTALPFSPRKMLLIQGDRKLVVADSFAGQLAVLDAAGGAVESIRELPGHNLRGLALSSDRSRLLVAHQVLNPQVTTSADDIHWGNLLTNNVRSLDLKAVLAPRADLLHGSQTYHLGEPTRGAADPAGLVITADGTMVVTLGGVGEVAFAKPAEPIWQREAVARRPTAIALSADHRKAFIANTLADSISILDLTARKVEGEIALGPAVTLGSADRGEQLFFDARLSHDGWLSCHTCHTDAHTSGLLNDNLSDGSYGTPKRILALGGVGDTAPFAWNGSVPDLESQIRKSLDTTMRGGRLAEECVRDLAAYLRTLPPVPGPGRFDGTAPERVSRGQAVFRERRCDGCHVPPTYTTRGIYDVGLADEAGLTHFNPPSLRGVGQGGPFLHDGRATTLEEVFAKYRHRLDGELVSRDLEALVAFLRTL